MKRGMNILGPDRVGQARVIAPSDLPAQSSSWFKHGAWNDSTSSCTLQAQGRFVVGQTKTRQRQGREGLDLLGRELFRGTHLVHRGAQTRLIGTKPDKTSLPEENNCYLSHLVLFSLLLSGLESVKRS